MFVSARVPAIFTSMERSPPPFARVAACPLHELEPALAFGREQWLNWVVRLATSGLIGYVRRSSARDRRAASLRLESYWGAGLAFEAVGDDLRLAAAVEFSGCSVSVEDFRWSVPRSGCPCFAEDVQRKVELERGRAVFALASSMRWSSHAALLINGCRRRFLARRLVAEPSWTKLNPSLVPSRFA